MTLSLTDLRVHVLCRHGFYYAHLTWENAQGEIDGECREALPRQPSPAEIVGVAAQLEVAEKRWWCQRRGMAGSVCHIHNAHPECGWRIVIPLEDTE